MTKHLLFRTGLVLTTSLLLAGTAMAQAVPVGGATLAQAAPQEEHRTGALRTPPEKLAKIPVTPVYRDFLPVAVDLSDYFPRIGDQARQGSCVAWATGFAARAYYAEVVEHRDITKPENVPSPAYIFNAIHQQGPADDPCGPGTDPADALQLLTDHGALSLADMPYNGADDANACPVLSKAQIDSATDFKIGGFERPQTWEDVKSELAQGNPVIIAADLDDGFMALHGPQGHGIWNSGPIDPKAPWEGHAFTLIGYDDQLQEFKFINSWSPEWGDEGFARLSYETAYNRINAAFVIRMPGNPSIQLAQKDFRSDVINYFAPTQKTGPSLGAASANAPEPVSGLWCGHVEVSKGVATGFVGSDAEIAKVKAQFGNDVDVSGVKVTPWPLCETQLTLGAALAETGGPTADLTAGADGSQSVKVKGAGSGYLYAVSFNADGTVTELDGSGAAKGDITGTLGKDAPALVVIAADKSILDSVPVGSTYRDFLSQLRDAVLHGATANISAKLVVPSAS